VHAKQMGITTILVKLRSPYISEEDITQYDAIYATYDYQVADKESLNAENTELFSPAFASLVNVITGKQQAQGHLPVSLSPNVVNRIPDPKVVTLPVENNVASELPKPN
jgi:beta-N-acetylhexosaminidase